MLKLTQELEKYLSLCPEEDILILKEKVPMTVESFNRVAFRMMKLNLLDVYYDIIMEYGDKFDDLTIVGDAGEWSKKAQKWLKDFLENLPKSQRAKYEFILD